MITFMIFRDLLELVSSHYDILDGNYNLNLIEEDIMMAYVAGKCKIQDCKECLRKEFSFKPPITTQSRINVGDPTE